MMLEKQCECPQCSCDNIMEIPEDLVEHVTPRCGSCIAGKHQK